MPLMQILKKIACFKHKRHNCNKNSKQTSNVSFRFICLSSCSFASCCSLTGNYTVNFKQQIKHTATLYLPIITIHNGDGNVENWFTQKQFRFAAS